MGLALGLAVGPVQGLVIVGLSAGPVVGFVLDPLLGPIVSSVVCPWSHRGPSLWFTREPYS